MYRSIDCPNYHELFGYTEPQVGATCAQIREGQVTAIHDGFLSLLNALFQYIVS